MLSEVQGWQSIDHPGKPRWENPRFPGLGNTPKNGSSGQYWVIRLFPPVFIMKYFKTACIVAQVEYMYLLKSCTCSEGGNNISLLMHW